MYHVMIVDDELSSRVRIKMALNTEPIDFIIDQEAVNGIDALEQLAVRQPDIVLVDMYMPIMNGVTLIEHIKTQYPTIPVVALSGYDDYEYVRSSLKLGAVDYLLKHNLSRESLLDILNKCTEEIQQIYHNQEAEKRQQNQENDIRKFQRRQAILKLLNGSYIDYDEFNKECLLDVENSYIQLILMKLDNSNYLKKINGKIALVMLSSVILSISQDVINRYGSGLIEFIDDSEYVIIITFKTIFTQQYILDQCQRLITALRECLKIYTNLTVSFSVGRVTSNLSEIPTCYRSAHNNLSLSYLTGENSLIKEEDSRNARKRFYTLTAKDDRKISDYVKGQNRQDCLSLIQYIFLQLIENKTDKESCQIISIELLNLLIRLVHTMPLSYDLQDDFCKLKRFVLSSESIQECQQYIINAFEDLFDFLDESGDLLKYNHHTIRAIEYIRKNLADDLSLNRVADALSINKSYLSRVFSNDCRKSFTKYVSSYRIEQAKKLLSSGESIKVTAKKIGICNLPYFFRIFKTYTGNTPQSYLQKVNKTQN